MRDKGVSNVTLKLSPFDFKNPVGFENSDYLHAMPEEKFDVIVVDGSEEWTQVRPICFQKAEDRVKPGGIIVVDDSWRYPGLRENHHGRDLRYSKVSVRPSRRHQDPTSSSIDGRQIPHRTRPHAGRDVWGRRAHLLFQAVARYFFVAMIVLAPMTEDFDINFLSRDFYRGTTRGIEISLVDVLSVSLLISSVLFPRRGQSRFFWPASFGFMLVFFLYACFNVAIADPHLFGLFELSKMIRGMTIFLAVAFFVQGEREMKLFLLALGLVVSYEGLLALRQRYQFGMHRVPGTVDDSNSLSVFFCTTAPIFVAAINSRIPAWLKGLRAPPPLAWPASELS